MSELHWKQSITDIEPNKVALRGYPIDELMGKISYSDAVYLALKGDLPSEETSKVIDAILVSSVDHGATPPSALAALTTASTGAPLNAALATGILTINKYHGGAIEDAMRTFLEVRDLMDEEDLSVEEASENILERYSAMNRRVMGFGHRIHSDDPRQKKLFQIARDAGVAGVYIEIAEQIQKSLAKQIGKKLPINVDGAIGAILCDLDFPPELANAFFIMARVPGLVAHIYEEQKRYKPMRKIHPTDHEYDGPKERHLK